MFHFSKSTLGFYVQGIHAQMPEDAVEVSDDEHAALMSGQAAGKRIVADHSGRPMLADPVPPSDADLAVAARRVREGLLVAADVAVNKAEDCGLDATPWRKYRQALRDVTAQKGFPASIQWPAAPAA